MKILKSLIVSIGLFACVVPAYAVTSPYGTYENFERVALNIDRENTDVKGLLINGEIFVSLEELQRHDKVAYTFEPDQYRAYVFFGGGDSGSDPAYSYYAAESKYKTKDELAAEVMKGIPYDDDNYHSGMMHQDIVNLVSFSKAFLTTLEMMDKAVQSKISINRDPNMELIEQSIRYRALPLEILEDRMEALADELGKQIGKREKRKMEDVIDLISDALKDQRKALGAMEDWLKRSDEDDLEDYRDYVKDVRENIYEAVKLLNGESLEEPGKVDEDNLKKAVEKWILKQ